MQISLGLISDFNIEIFGRFLANSEDLPFCDIELAGFGQVYQALHAHDSEHGKAGATVIWTRPEGVLQSFQQALDMETVDPAK